MRTKHQKQHNNRNSAKGLNLFGDKSYKAAKDEIEKNLLGRGCIDMFSTYNLAWDIRKQALGYSMFLNRKLSGKIKGKGCANGCPQQEHITNEGLRSLIVSLYDLMGSYVIDVMKGRKIITVAIPGAFLQGDWPKEEHPGYIMFEGIMVDMICEINLAFRDMIRWSKDSKHKFLYGWLIKTVYGTFGAIILYNKLSKHLTDHGFTWNKYDILKFNKTVNGDQMTVQFHVDDLKVSLKK